MDHKKLLANDVTVIVCTSSITAATAELGCYDDYQLTIGRPVISLNTVLPRQQFSAGHN